MKKSVTFFDFATTIFSLSSASLLDFSFSQPLLYSFIFIFKLAKVLRLETFRLVNIGKSVVGYPSSSGYSLSISKQPFQTFLISIYENPQINFCYKI